MVHFMTFSGDMDFFSKQQSECRYLNRERYCNLQREADRQEGWGGTHEGIEEEGGVRGEEEKLDGRREIMDVHSVCLQLSFKRSRSFSSELQRLQVGFIWH